MEEENHFKDQITQENADSSQEQEKPLTGEQILEAVKAENKNGDEYERKIYSDAMRTGLSLSFIIVPIMVIVELLVLDRIPYALWAVMFTPQGFANLLYGLKTERNRKLYLVSGIFQIAVSIFFVVMWALQLAGVVE